MSRREIHFPPYRLDLDAGFLRAGERTVSLRPKTWAVLCYLAERPGLLVTKDELLDAVWGDVAVTEATLTKSIGEIRDALQDEVRHPRFVETVHRRGFRFLSPVEEPGVAPAPQTPVPSPEAPADMVGREAEIARLLQLLALAGGGSRQIAFVTGEAGIGKTTLVEAFLATAPVSGSVEVSVATGRCIRRHSLEEPLMPVLEAIGRLARGRHAARVVQLLREHAPGWLVQLPWLVEPGDLRELRASLAGTTAERMLRVFAQLVEELTTEVTLVLVLEDLQWADPGTVDLVSILAERPDRARLLVLGTYRPAEVIARGGPFDGMRRALSVKRRSVELPLPLLPPPEVQTYLATRFGGDAVPAPLARLLHAQTEGNPLFLVTAVDFLIARGLLEPGDRGAVLRADLETLERQIPGSLQEMVEAHILDLEPLGVAVLEAASVAGLEFGAQAVSAALGTPLEQVEDACERLVRSHRFLRASGTEAWPDGAVAARYTFTHAVYQRVFYRRVPAGRRRVLHQRIGERLEAGFGARADEVVVELAEHFEQSPNPARAIAWLERAATSALARFAPREAAGYLRRALALLANEADGAERARTELELTFSLGAAAMAAAGVTAEEAWVSLVRAHELAARVGSPLDRLRVLITLVTASTMRAEQSPGLVDELATVAGELAMPATELVAAGLSASVAFWEGRFAEAAALARVAGADPEAMRNLFPNVNPVVWAKCQEGWRLWLVGHPDRARASVEEGLACARSLRSPISVAVACFFGADVLLWRGEPEAAATLVEEGRALAAEHGFALWIAALACSAAEIGIERGDGVPAVAALRGGVEEIQRIGFRIVVPRLLGRIAAGLLQLGQIAQGLSVVDEGLELVRTTLGGWSAAELWRIRGELLATGKEPTEAVDASFVRALQIARSQGARSLELRAATALARQLAARGRKAEARATLAPSYEAFTEGTETADLRAARALLQRLGG